MWCDGVSLVESSRSVSGWLAPVMLNVGTSLRPVDMFITVRTRRDFPVQEVPVTNTALLQATRVRTIAREARVAGVGR